MKFQDLLSAAHAAMFASCFALLGLAACSDDGSAETGDETETSTGDSDTTEESGETAADDTLSIIGSYTDEYGDMHEVGADSWSNAAGSFAIDSYDNDDMWLVAQNAESNEYSPGLWSRFDWAWDGETLYYCQSVFDGMTMADAMAGGADAADLTMGCGGFAWTNLTP